MIHVSNLTKTFGDLKAVDGVSFDVPAGEIFAFLGPNGAGKTTTIQMLTTLLRPTAGQITLDALRPVHPDNHIRRAGGAGHGVIGALDGIGKLHLRKSHAGSPANLESQRKMFHDNGGRFPAEAIREARRRQKSDRSR